MYLNFVYRCGPVTPLLITSDMKFYPFKTAKRTQNRRRNFIYQQLTWKLTHLNELDTVLADPIPHHPRHPSHILQKIEFIATI